MFDLFDSLGATEEQLDFPIMYASALNGVAGDDPAEMSDDMEPLFTHFAGLEYLEIWGYHGRNAAGNKQALVFGSEIANLTELAELEVVSACMNTLPAEMSALANLRIVRLRNHDFVRFPAALATVPNLESLEFSHMSDLSSFGSVDKS